MEKIESARIYQAHCEIAVTGKGCVVITDGQRWWIAKEVTRQSAEAIACDLRKDRVDDGTL